MREAEIYTSDNHLDIVSEYGEYFTQSGAYPLFNFTLKPYYMCSSKDLSPLLFFNKFSDAQYFCLELNTYLILIHKYGGSELLS